MVREDLLLWNEQERTVALWRIHYVYRGSFHSEVVAADQRNHVMVSSRTWEPEAVIETK